MALHKFCFLLLTIAIYGSLAATETASVNERPIIGILTQEVGRLIKRVYKDENYQSYIAASYVKYIEGAGGRVVPIWINQSRLYYEDILSKVNGVLFPGGATYFNNSDGYADAGAQIYEIAKEMNDRGDYLPIWGTCLGMEFLVYIEANATDYRTLCSSSSQPAPLELQPGYEQSRIFATASAELISTFKNDNVTINFHMYCFTPETFALNKLDNSWKVLSLNKDWNDITFISTIEHKKYPFYGVQFHPEKILYEFITKKNIPHTAKAVSASQYLANFFLSEVRKNNHNFEDKTEEVYALIYNYNPAYTGAQGSAFVQQYLFKTNDADLEQILRDNGSSKLMAGTGNLLLVFVVCLICLNIWQH